MEKSESDERTLKKDLVTIYTNSRRRPTLQKLGNIRIIPLLKSTETSNCIMPYLFRGNYEPILKTTVLPLRNAKAHTWFIQSTANFYFCAVKCELTTQCLLPLVSSV